MPRLFACVLVLSASLATALAQGPSDPPTITAANEDWYRSREPIPFAGGLYYPSGAAVFFDQNTMVRSGYHGNVPLYTDTTVEPYSLVLVPVRRGLLQPYERRRSGQLAGTTGSRTPAFPVNATASSSGLLEGAAPPMGILQPVATLGTAQPPAAEAVVPQGRPVDSVMPAPGRPNGVVSSVQPDGNHGVWIRFSGERWVSAGAAVPLKSSAFRVTGQYAGFPVFAKSGEEGTIYLPTRAGLVAPYRVSREAAPPPR